MRSSNTDSNVRAEISEKLMQTLTDEYLNSVISNYQNKIRIGCFTDSSNNEKMWKKYAGDKTGCCIEYDTSKTNYFNYPHYPYYIAIIPMIAH